MSTDVTPTPQPAAAPAPGSAARGLIVGGIVSLAVGVVLGVVSLVLLLTGVVGAVSDWVNAPVYPYPGSATVSLDAGTYVIFESTSTASVSSPDLYRVAGPDGEPLTLGAPGLDQRFTRSEGDFVGVATFHASQSGTYEVTATALGDSTGYFMVARDLGSAVTGRAAWGIGVAGGGLLVVLGIVLLAVGLTQRSRARSAAAAAANAAAYPGYYGSQTYPGSGYPTAYQQPYAQPAQPPYAQPAQAAQQPYAQPYQQPAQQPAQPAAPPPGWYPDPARPGGRRYWDGTAWTSHTA